MEQLEIDFLLELDSLSAIAWKELRYKASRFTQMLNGYGAVETAKRLISKGISDGFTDLYMKERLDLTMEAVVIKEKYKSLFTEEEIAICKHRLEEGNYKLI